MAGSRNDTFKVNVEYAPSISGGDELRNINCYEYLVYLYGKISKDSKFISIGGLKDFFTEHPDYRDDIPYGDLYTAFLDVLEFELNALEPTPGKYDEAIKNDAEVIAAIYSNPNNGLERTAKMIESATISGRDTSSQSTKMVKRRLTASSDTQVNQITPQQIGSFFGRASAFYNAVIHGEFKPQLSTSMSSIRRYAYTNKSTMLPMELRFGTQGEFHRGSARVSPLFEAWLRVINAGYSHASTVSYRSAAAAATSQPLYGIDEMKASATSPLMSNSGIQQEEALVQPPTRNYAHVYFNNLGLDRDSIEGKLERELTLALHAFESRHPQIVVITLPADKGLLDFSMLNKHQKEISYEQAFDRILNVALGRSDEKIKDFYISKEAREALFGKDIDTEKSRFEALLLNSFSRLGFKPGDKLTPAEFHAVYFHFIKFELSNYILTKLKPVSFNMSCKDAIDRGGVSSAYYNLLKSIELGDAMSKEEFLRALHAAPALVKGRGINHHVKAIWNALNHYVNHADKSTLPEWLPQWVAENRLVGTREDFIKKLEMYIETRRKESSSLRSLFSVYAAPEKISASHNLLSLLRGDIAEFKPDPKELGALNDGRLGALVEEMRNFGILAADQFKYDRGAHYHLGPTGL